MKLFLISILLMSLNIIYYACDSDDNGDTFPDTVPGGNRISEKLLKELN